MRTAFIGWIAALCVVNSCSRETKKPDTVRPVPRRPVLLITLDTTRADMIDAATTPELIALAARGREFSRAYATVPQTLPSHSSMLTGFYAAGHGVHENARVLPEKYPVAAERLRATGYHTAAFVSSYILARRFGLARGFETYDDAMPSGSNERSSRDTTDRAIAYLQSNSGGPLFLWVHYFDPHAPYQPPEPFRSRYAGDPYRGEIAAMDQQVGRLVRAFDKATGGGVVIAAGDHGEGRGDHGEMQHGTLLYEGVMRVPLILAGPGIAHGASNAPVSTRRIFNTILDAAGIDASGSLLHDENEVVLGEAMKPFLEYGWQPQVMAVEASQKVIHAGRLEVYDVVADPGETRDLTSTAQLSRPVRQALRDYPVPSLAPAPTGQTLDEEERRKLASLGYVSSDTRPVVRADAPRPADMTAMFDLLDKASGLFVQERYREVIPLLEQILANDPHNLDSALRLGASYSLTGQNEKAVEAFRRAETIAPDSPDVRQYLALHFARTGEFDRAAPMLERVLVDEPARLPALEALADIREKQGNLPQALALRKRILALTNPSPRELLRTGQLAMDQGDTATAIDAFEKLRATEGTAFRNNMELGVLYVAARRFEDARTALDQVKPSDPGYPMSLFKRAQVSVLLNEPDAADRIRAAREHADETTRQLIERERLFQ